MVLYWCIPTDHIAMQALACIKKLLKSALKNVVDDCRNLFEIYQTLKN